MTSIFPTLFGPGLEPRTPTPTWSLKVGYHLNVDLRKAQWALNFCEPQEPNHFTWAQTFTLRKTALCPPSGKANLPLSKVSSSRLGAETPKGKATGQPLGPLQLC